MKKGGKGLIATASNVGSIAKKGGKGAMKMSAPKKVGK